MKREDVLNELKALDREFCNECKINGVDGWIKFFAEDSVMVSDGDKENIKGRENIYNFMKQVFDLPGFSLEWETEIVDVSDDFSLGYTSGTYIRIYNYGENKEVGKYNTVWKKNNGEWKISLDMGN